MQLLILLLAISVAAWGHTSASADQIIHYNLQAQIRYREAIYREIQKIRRLPRHKRNRAMTKLKTHLTKKKQSYARQMRYQKEYQQAKNEQRRRFAAYHNVKK